MKLVCRAVFLFFVFISILINTTFANEYNFYKAPFSGAYMYSADYLNEDIINNENNKPLSNLTNRDSRLVSGNIKDENCANFPLNIHAVIKNTQIEKLFYHTYFKTNLKDNNKKHFIALLSQVFPQAP